jgi:hypothetical protein
MGITTLAAVRAVSLGFEMTSLMFLIGWSARATPTKTTGISHSMQMKRFFIVEPRRK